MPTEITTALQLLADRRRRTVLRYLVETSDGTVTTEELVAGITDTDSLQRGESPDHIRRIRNELVHTHLPKLAEEGVIEYDQANETVLYRPDSTLEDLLSFISETLE